VTRQKANRRHSIRIEGEIRVHHRRSGCKNVLKKGEKSGKKEIFFLKKTGKREAERGSKTKKVTS